MADEAARLSRERAARLEELFRHAVQLEGEARARYLADACHTDAQLWRDVHALLAADASASEADLAGGSIARHLAAAHAAADASGTVIGPYRVIRLLGSGGMGSVYLAEREDVHKQVAIKLLHGTFRSTDATRRFLVEQKVLARLDHRHIARFLDAGISPSGTPYLVMEYVPGESLLTYSAGRRLSERLALFEAACEAVAYAHQHLVVHRDLKPSNILVDRQGCVKLLDFGIAKLLEDDDEGLTRDGTRLMTPEYATPEQIRGEPITPATDVYALGVLLFELLTDSSPYSVTGSSAAKIEQVVCESVVPVPSSRPAEPFLPAGIPADLDAICLHALEKVPDDRYATAAELRADLQRHLADLPIEARVPTATYRFRKFVRRHRLGVAAALALATLLATGVAAVIGQARRAERERGRADAERQRAEQALAESESVTDFMIGLFESQDPAIARGAEPSARELIERGRQRAQLLTEQPLVRARMLDSIGRVYHGMADYAAAEPPLREALAIRQQALGLRHADVAASHHHLGSLLHDRGTYREAEPQYQAALALRRELLGPSDPLVADTLGRYGLLVLRARNDDKLADEYMRNAVAILRTHFGNDHPRVASMLNTLAAVPDARGDHAASEQLLREALAIQHKHLGETHPSSIETLGNLAVTLGAKGDLAAAEATTRQANELDRRIHGPKHVQVIIGLNNLASILRRQRKAQEAEATYREALALAQGSLGPDHQLTAWLGANLASVLVDRRAFREAEVLYAQSLEKLRARLGDDHSMVQRVRQRIADMRKVGGFAESPAMSK
jgi:tetratricopeptide (TPR) repeat protein